jgi:hypothetical protein
MRIKIVLIEKKCVEKDAGKDQASCCSKVFFGSVRQLVKVDLVEKYEKPNESHEEEHKEIQRARKHQRVLKAVGIDQGNVVEGKREWKRKGVIDW